MKKPFPKMVLRILLVCVLLLGFLYMDDDPSDISFAAAEVFPELKGESRNSRSMGITSGPSSL